MLKCYVTPILLEERERWKLSLQMKRRFEAIKICLYTRMLRLPEIERRSNGEVLTKIRGKRTFTEGRNKYLDTYKFFNFYMHNK